MCALRAQKAPALQKNEPEKSNCRTEATQVEVDMESKKDQQAYRQLLQQYMGMRQQTITEYTIQIHIVRMDDGTGGINVATVRNEIQNWVNPYFADVNAAFVECSPELYHNSTEYYNLGDGSEDPDVAGDAMSAAFNVANVVNVYFVNDPAGACGWARFPWRLPADYIVIANGCADNKSTLVHELGHYFSLYHTHETAFGAENVTRNSSDGCYDCDVHGDLMCDTPADPNLSGLVTNACVYTGSGTDACSVTYTPDPTLIMSYSAKACRTLFSAAQKAKLTLTMASAPGDPLFGRNYLQTTCPCDRPFANCKNVTVDLNAAGNASITPASVDNGSTWDCGFGSWTVSPNTFNCGNVGPNTVTLSLTDALGWVSTCQATVTIRDVTNPVIMTPASNMIVECDGNGNTTAFTNWLNAHGGATASDACGGSWTDNHVGLSNGCGASGSETVTFTYTDPSGNKAETTATFTIVDTTPPTVVCPSDIHLPECVETATWVATASDVCGSVSIVSNPPSGSSFAKGSTNNITVTATDDCNNPSQCLFRVTRDPDLVVSIDPVATNPLNTCALGTSANIVLGYGGGPTCVTLHATASGGHGPYTYSWKAPTAVPSGSFLNKNTPSPKFCAGFQSIPCATYTFEVTVTDYHGCTETNEVNVSVVNPLCVTGTNPKVAVCHYPPGNPANRGTICISPNAVYTHLYGSGHMDCLGACDQTCVSYSARMQDPSALQQNPDRSFEITVQPNPFNTSTVIRIQSNATTNARLTIIDFSGRVLATLYEGPMQEGIQYYVDFDASELPAGFYIARMVGVDGYSAHSSIMMVVK